ncbi:MAG: TonB-dependent receptor [Brachymonas sp.]|nr:TonB-dependent receptor [Brachymonas sp.]
MASVSRPNGRWWPADPTAFNAPTLGYLYYPFGGNANLLPEKAKSAEIGVQWSQKNQVLRATVFDTRSRNLFEYDLVNNSFANVANTRNRGLEVSYNAKLGHWDLRASLTSQHPKDVGTGQSLNRRAKTLAALSVDHTMGAWDWGGDLRMSGSRRDGAKQLPAYELLDLRMRYRFDPQWSAFARIENVFNRSYQTVSGYNQAPRGVFVGMQWQPQL